MSLSQLYVAETQARGVIPGESTYISQDLPPLDLNDIERHKELVGERSVDFTII